MARICTLIVVCTMTMGCNERKTNRIPVAGMVRYKGHPVSYGAISFRPDANTMGPAAGTDIRNGSYSILGKAGPVTGSYLARITIVEQDFGIPQRFLRKGHRVKSIEVPIEIRNNQVDYNFALGSKK